MRKMKDSKIEWVGEIPEGWSVARLKNIILLLTDYTANGSFGDLAKNVQYLDYEDYARLVRLTDLRDNFQNNGVYVSKESYQYLSKSSLFGKEILVANVGAYAGLFCEMPEVSGFATLGPNMFLLRTNERLLQHYLLYLGNADFVWRQLIQKAISSAQPKLNKSDVKTVYIVFPSLLEQRRIADFLDRECERIDGLKANIEEQIETLEKYKRSVITEAVTHGLNPAAPMKDSGVDYIDKIKYNWKISKIGFVCTKLTRGFLEKDPALICSNNGSVMLRDEQHSFGKMVSEDNAMQGIRAGDIAIHGMDTWHGAIGLSTIRGKITRVVHVCDSTEDKRFIVYYLKSLAYQGVYKLISSGVRGNTSDFRSWDKVKDIFICLPETVDEEREICDYLDKIVSATDELISQKQSQIETLETYKKSLIFEYVTGKKEVT